MMTARAKIVLRLALALAALAALVPAAALAQPMLDDYDGWWGRGGWGSTDDAPAWCHIGDYGQAALSDRATMGRVAGALGLTPSRLSDELRDGADVADMAAERGVRLQAAVDAALARHRDIVRWRVEDGYLTQRQGDEVLGLMEEQLRAAFELGSDQGFGRGPRSGSGSYRSAPSYPPFRFGEGLGMMGGFFSGDNSEDAPERRGWGPGGMMGGWGRLER